MYILQVSRHILVEECCTPDGTELRSGHWAVPSAVPIPQVETANSRPLTLLLSHLRPFFCGTDNAHVSLASSNSAVTVSHGTVVANETKDNLYSYAIAYVYTHAPQLLNKASEAIYFFLVL